MVTSRLSFVFALTLTTAAPYGCGDDGGAVNPATPDAAIPDDPDAAAPEIDAGLDPANLGAGGKIQIVVADSRRYGSAELWSDAEELPGEELLPLAQPATEDELTVYDPDPRRPAAAASRHNGTRPHRRGPEPVWVPGHRDVRV